MFKCPGDQQRANRQSTTHKKALDDMVNTIDFLREKQSLRKSPHAFGSESVEKFWDRKGLLKKAGVLLLRSL